MPFTLCDARLIDVTTDIACGYITIDGTRIQSVERPDYSPGRQENIIDAAGMIIMPGFIDVHTHGGGGFNLHTTDPEEIWNYGRWVSSTGVTSYLIASVGTPGYWPEPQLRASVEALEGWHDSKGGDSLITRGRDPIYH